MKEKASPKRLKGTVLFTVVSVMMVLIVFLMGTLALAATASNRAASNYQKAQTEATARTVIDSVVQAINTNEDIRSQVASMTTIGSSISLDVQGTDGMSEDVTITCRDKRQMFDTAEQEWNENGYIYEVTTTVDKTKAETTYSAYIGAIRPETDAPGGGGGAFVSLGDIGGQEIGTGGYITGGTYIGVDYPDTEWYELGKNGTTTIDAPFYVNGNVTNTNVFNMHFTNPGDYFVVTGDMIYSQTNQFATVYDFGGTIAKYEDVPYIFVGGRFSPFGQITIGKPDSTDSTKIEVPTNLYCGSIGPATITSYNITVGKDTNSDGIDDTSVVETRTVTANGAGGLKVYGDIYTFKSGVESVLNVTADNGKSTLYKWASKTLNKADGTATSLGNWYSAGSVKIQSNEVVINGDLRVAENLTIDTSSPVTVIGDVVVGGTLNITSGTLKCGNIYATNVDNKGTIDCSGTVKAKTYGGTGTLKDKVVPTQQVKVSYVENTPTTYELKATHDWGDQYAVTYNVTISRQVVHPDGSLDPATTETRAETEKWVDVTPAGQVVTAASLLKELGIENGTIQEYATTSPYVQIAAGSDVETEYGKDIYPEAYNETNIKDTVLTKPVLTDYTSYPKTIDELAPQIYRMPDGTLNVGDGITDTETGTGAIEITDTCMLTGTFDNNIYINPGTGKPITVILKDVSISDAVHFIIVNDASQVTLFISGRVYIAKGGIITTDYLDAIIGAGAWDVNTVTGAFAWNNEITVHQNAQPGDPDYPNVIIFAEEGTNAELSLDQNETLVTALIRAPELTVKQRIAYQANNKIHYDKSGSITDYGKDTSITKGTCAGVIGQLIAKRIVMPNARDWGQLFIDAGTPKKCTCGCAKCTDPEHPTKCTCKSNGCMCPDCICTGHLAGYSTPDAYNVMYYNFY